MQINFDYDPSTAIAPAGFVQALDEAASIISTKIINTPLTLTLNVGWGEVGGVPITGSELAAAGPTGKFVDYNTLVTDFRNEPNQSADDQAFNLAAFGVLPHGGVQRWFLPTAEAKALGVQDPTTTESDGILGVSSNFAYTFSQDAGSIAAGTFDLVGILFHEITHAMGRFSNTARGFFTPLDAGAYNKIDALPQPNDGPPGRYFSIDGTTPLAGLSSVSDPADLDGTNGFLPSLPGFQLVSDSFNAFLSPATLYPWSDIDSRMMDVLGFQTAGSQPPQQDDDNKNHHHHKQMMNDHHHEQMMSDQQQQKDDPASVQTLAQLVPTEQMFVQPSDFASLIPSPDLRPGGSAGEAAAWICYPI